MGKLCENYKEKMLNFFNTSNTINEIDELHGKNDDFDDFDVVADDEISKELQIDDKQVLINDIIQIIPIVQEIDTSNLYDDVIQEILSEYNKQKISLCTLNNYLNILYSIYYQLSPENEQEDIDAFMELDNIPDDIEDTYADADIGNEFVGEAKSHQTSGQRRQMQIRRKSDHALKRKIALRLKRNKNICSKAGPFSSWSNKLKKCVYKSPIKSASLKIQARTRRKNM